MKRGLLTLLLLGMALSPIGQAHMPSGQACVLEGDLNHDCRVDGADYTIWLDHIGSQGATLPSCSLIGDANCDDIVDIHDYNMLIDDWGKTCCSWSHQCGDSPLQPATPGPPQLTTELRERASS